MNSPYMKRFRVSQEFKKSHTGLDLVGVDSKEIHVVVAGEVIKAGWENPNNHAQGFGQYVKVRAANGDVWYYGHLSKILATVGQKVAVTDVIGIEGSTGNSTGSHLHIECRHNGDRAQTKDVSRLLGIPNAIDTYTDGYAERTEAQAKATSEIETVAKEVIAGKWGNGSVRKQKLTEAGYNYAEVQKKVNEIL